MFCQDTNTMAHFAPTLVWCLVEESACGLCEALDNQYTFVVQGTIAGQPAWPSDPLNGNHSEEKTNQHERSPYT